MNERYYKVLGPVCQQPQPAPSECGEKSCWDCDQYKQTGVSAQGYPVHECKAPSEEELVEAVAETYCDTCSWRNTPKCKSHETCKPGLRDDARRILQALRDRGVNV